MKTLEQVKQQQLLDILKIGQVSFDTMINYLKLSGYDVTSHAEEEEEEKEVKYYCDLDCYSSGLEYDFGNYETITYNVWFSIKLWRDDLLFRWEGDKDKILIKLTARFSDSHPYSFYTSKNFTENKTYRMYVSSCEELVKLLDSGILSKKLLKVYKKMERHLTTTIGPHDYSPRVAKALADPITAINKLLPQKTT